MPQLVCKVASSPLAHERALFVEDADRRELESWASADLVTVEGGDEGGLDEGVARGLVRVRLVEEDRAGGRALVELPQELVLGGRRLWVPSEALRR